MVIRRILWGAWYWAPVLGYAGLIFFMSSMPNPEELAPSVFDAVGDKGLHGIEYGILGLLCFRAFRRAAGARAADYALELAVAAASLYGLTDEVHQAFVPSRESSMWDWVADTLGAWAAVAGWQWLSTIWTGNQR